MTESSHTPGPWFVGKSARNGARVFATQFGTDGVVAAGIENRANARLIAAAPDLLRSCIVAIDWLSDKGVPADHVEMRRLRDAVAMTEGSQP